MGKFYHYGVKQGGFGTKWSDTMPESTVVVVLQISENQLVPTSYKYSQKRLYGWVSDWFQKKQLVPTSKYPTKLYGGWLSNVRP